MKKHRFHISREIRQHMDTFDLFSEPEAGAADAVEDTKQGLQEERCMEAATGNRTQGAGMEAISRTHIGCIRKTNQDAILEAPPLWGVADGMGGHRGGETASAMCRDGLIRLLRDRDTDIQSLINAVRLVNRRIHFESEDNKELAGMGTTLTCVWVGEDTISIAHVGDSRLYLLREGVLRQVTDDHSMVMEMVRAGILTREQANNHPMRNVITRAVGTEREVEVDGLCEARKPGDVWLLCSDGLYGQVSEDRIREQMMQDSLEEASDTLIRLALEAGGPDNISLVLLRDVEGLA